MDRVKDIDRDRVGDRLGERNVNTQRVLEAETEKEASAMLQEYNLGGFDRDDQRSPPKLERVSEYVHPDHSPTLHPSLHPPPLIIDISSVCFRPVPVRAQAEMTSTYGHPRLNWPEMAKVDMYTITQVRTVSSTFQQKFNAIESRKK